MSSSDDFKDTDGSLKATRAALYASNKNKKGGRTKRTPKKLRSKNDTTLQNMTANAYKGKSRTDKYLMKNKK